VRGTAFEGRIIEWLRGTSNRGKFKPMTFPYEKTLGLHLGQTLGPRIAARRKALNLTQNDLAERLHVETETISRFERGHSLPSLRRLALLAEVLDTEIGALLTGTSAYAGAQATELQLR
jgi:DNA-binding XRE family transcriptional regulator